MSTCTITTLVDNVVYDRGLVAEHGFSVYIDCNGVRVLFDTGQTDTVTVNAHALGIDLGEIDACVISHGHYDHTGGLASFCRLNAHAPVFIHADAWLPKWNSHKKAIGISHAESIDRARCVSIEKPHMIAPDIYCMPAATIAYEDDTHRTGFFCEKNGEMTDDDFSDEQSLVIIKNEHLNIISGCSHRGISNIITAAKTHFKLPVGMVVGGMHLLNESIRRIEQLCAILNSMNIQRVGVGHCTGIDAYSTIQQKLTCEVFYNSVGTKIIL